MPVTTPKLPPPPRKPQKRSGFSSLCRADQACLGGDEVHADHVVHRPCPAPREVAEAAAEGESGDPGHRDEPEDGGESGVQLRLAVQVAEQTTRLGVGDPSACVSPRLPASAKGGSSARRPPRPGRQCCFHRP